MCSGVVSQEMLGPGKGSECEKDFSGFPRFSSRTAALEARGQHRPCWVRKGWQAPSSHGFQGGLQVPWGGEERSAKSESCRP